jgi:hypothetical protein
VTVHALAVEPLDVSADALGLLLNAPAPATLAELRLADGDGGELVLGVLSASHVVTATRPGHRLTEHVSCDALAAGGTCLPAVQEHDGYRLTTCTRNLPAAALSGLAARLRAAAVGDGWLCGAFPGADTALTALRGEAVSGGWRWQTWHLYPTADDTCADGVVVETSTMWRP